MSDLNSETIAKVTAALIDAKAEFGPVLKDATNPHFQSKFASLRAVFSAVDDALSAHRLVLVQQPDVDDKGSVLVSRLIHESGEYLGSVYRLSPVQQTPQGEGSALTYARRYAAQALLGIAPEDDDGAAGSAPARQRREDPEAQGPDPRQALWNDIARRGKEAGTSTQEIRDDFAAWLPGKSIDGPDTTVDELTRYYHQMPKGEKA